jgi:CRP-like cAMP-binding protein|tara:strand:+ start:64 stop:390 length:327 start_codon:yes stop_codon:yes gene_type:complete
LKKEILIKYGDQGKDYFILSKGSVRVILYEPGTKPDDPDLDKKKTLVKYMGQGSGFGELALLYNDKRSATIEAVSDNCETYTLNGTIFKTIIIKSSIEKRSQQAGFLN